MEQAIKEKEKEETDSLESRDDTEEIKVDEDVDENYHMMIRMR